MDYIYIDESGDLGSDSNYLVFGAVIVDNKTKLDRIINKIRRQHKKQLGKDPEIKGTKTNPFIIKKILKKLDKIEYQTIIIIFDKKNKNKINYNYDNNLLYDIIASKLAKEIHITNKTHIIVDKSKNKEKYRKNFNQLFVPNLNNPKTHKVHIKHGDSINHKGLQIADLVAWSTYQCIEYGNNEFIELINNKSIKIVF